MIISAMNSASSGGAGLYLANESVPLHSKFAVPSGLPVLVPLALAPLSMPVPPLTFHLLLPDTIILFFDVPVNV
jgi:hypothetical protein